MNGQRKSALYKSPQQANGLLVGVAKSMTNLTFDQRCYEFEREQGRQLGGIEGKTGKVEIMYSYYKLKKLKMIKSMTII